MNRKEGWFRELAKTAGTPAYLFDLDAFAHRAKQVQSQFGDTVALCFSMKANPFLLEHLPAAFEKIEVCSPGELTICEKMGIAMDRVIFSGVNKTATDIARAMEDQVGTFTVESRLHAELIHKEATRRGIRVPTLIRVSGGSQFGMDPEAVVELIRHREEYAGLEIVGLHYFTGTQKRKAAVIGKELDWITAFADRLTAETGFVVDRLEYGTGLAVDYFSEEAEAQELERLAAIADPVRKAAERFSLTLEMGRFFAAPCGYYCTKVMDCKENEGVSYAILDGGLHQLKYDGQIQGMQIPQILHFPAHPTENEPAKPWTLCGSLCTTADVLARNVPLQQLSMGDLLVFCRTGAYSVTEGMALFLSRELPAVAFWSAQEGLQICRPLLTTDPLHTAH